MSTMLINRVADGAIPASTVSVELLGPLDLRVGPHRIGVAGYRQQTIVAVLAMTPGRVVSVETLIEAVWPVAPPATARTQIAICIVGLRKALEKHAVERDVIATAAPGYVLQVRPEQVDVTRFTDLVDRAGAAAEAGELAEAVEQVGAALAAWRGAALSGLSCHLLELEAARLEEQRLTAVELWAGWSLELGRHSEVVTELSALVARNPLREAARAHLMLAQYRAGLRAEALANYREGRRIFIDEFGLDPGPLTQRVHEAILRADPALTYAEDALATATVVPAQLLADPTGFLGRETELRLLDGARDRPPARRDGPLVAYLTGSQGTGKTALATHWAHRVADDYPDGQFHLDLGDAATDQLGTCLRTLGVAAGNVPSARPERRALYRSILSKRRVLVLLDDARSADQVVELLPGSAGSCVVVTGRQMLYGLVGQHCSVHLQLGRLTEFEAVELLESLVGPERIAADPAAARRLARLCDLLPLALCIAGARLAGRPRRSVRQVVERMADESRRLDELTTADHDMRAALAETCAGLPEAEAALLRGIGTLPEDQVSVPTCAALLHTTPAAAEATVERLVDRALAEKVDAGFGRAPRYRLSGLVHLYVRELARRRVGPLGDMPPPSRVA